MDCLTCIFLLIGLVFILCFNPIFLSAVISIGHCIFKNRKLKSKLHKEKV
jgi:hypothetical protein